MTYSAAPNAKPLHCDCRSKIVLFLPTAASSTRSPKSQDGYDLPRPPDPGNPVNMQQNETQFHLLEKEGHCWEEGQGLTMQAYIYSDSQIQLFQSNNYFSF